MHKKALQNLNISCLAIRGPGESKNAKFDNISEKCSRNSSVIFEKGPELRKIQVLS